MNRNAKKYRFALIVALLFAMMYLLGIVRVEIDRKARNVVDMKEADRDDKEALVTVTRDGNVYLGQPGQDKAQLPDSGTEIRIRNASDINLNDVVVDGEKFGDIKQGAITEYRKSKLAHRYPSASLSANSKRLETQPIVYAAETELGHGSFTYLLTIHDAHLYVRADKDKD